MAKIPACFAVALRLLPSWNGSLYFYFLLVYTCFVPWLIQYLWFMIFKVLFLLILCFKNQTRFLLGRWFFWTWIWRIPKRPPFVFWAWMLILRFCQLSFECFDCEWTSKDLQGSWIFKWDCMLHCELYLTWIWHKDELWHFLTNSFIVKAVVSWLIMMPWFRIVWKWLLSYR